uniref:Uncharacterized protein n=1 Tax=Vombatus ursinus TaxID=29139 RepID=A0A4X2LDG5_VOMUR
MKGWGWGGGGGGLGPMLVVMGSGCVGKSALTIQLVKNCFVPDHDPTIEDSYRTQLIVDGQSCQLDILDTTGDEEMLSRRHQFMRWGEGFLCVYAVDDIKSFVDVNIFRDQLRRIRGADRIPFVLVANKVDLGNSLVHREVHLLALALPPKPP